MIYEIEIKSETKNETLICGNHVRMLVMLTEFIIKNVFIEKK